MSEAIGLVFRQERNHEPIDSDRLPLRQRMIEDMRLRKLNGKTQIAYVRAVRRFAGFLRRSPDTATGEDLRRYPSAPSPTANFGAMLRARSLNWWHHRRAPHSPTSRPS